MNRLHPSWWQFGLLGGISLSIATLVNAVISIPRFFREDFPWGDLPLLSIEIFTMGFACGALVAVLRGLSKRLGAVGDGLIGVIVLNFFFLCCMLLFARELLFGRVPGAGPMLIMASVVGAIGGVWLGRDLRKEPWTEPSDDSSED